MKETRNRCVSLKAISAVERGFLSLSLFLFKRGEDYDLQMGLLSVTHRKQAQDPSPPVANGTRLRGAAVVSQ